MTPSPPDETAYRFAVIAIGHAVLGAALHALAVAALGLPPLPAGVALAAGYWLAKEAPDLRRGGRLGDGLADCGFVALGAFYGAPFWPVAVLLAAGLSALLREVWRG